MSAFTPPRLKAVTEGHGRVGAELLDGRAVRVVFLEFRGEQARTNWLHIFEAAPELLSALEKLSAAFYADEPCRVQKDAMGHDVHKLSSGHLVAADSCPACAARDAIAKARAP